MIAKNRLSSRLLTAPGHHLDDSPVVISREERWGVWKRIGVKDIVAREKKQDLFFIVFIAFRYKMAEKAINMAG